MPSIPPYSPPPFPAAYWDDRSKEEPAGDVGGHPLAGLVCLVSWYPGIWAALAGLCWLRRRCWRRVVCALSSRGCEIYRQNIKRGRSRAWVSAPPVVVYSALAPVVDLRALLRFSLVSFHAWALSTLSGDSVASASVAKSYIFLSLFPPQTPPIALSIRRSIN